MIDKLIKLVRKGFKEIQDHRASNASYYLEDLLSAGFAIFSLKDPSLLAFRNNYESRSDNLKRVYFIEHIPEDSALREGLDRVDPQHLQAQFQAPIEVLRQHKVIEQRQVLGGYVAVSCDGTGHYCSSKTHCAHCLVKEHRNGSKSYYHQLMGAVMVHPDEATVFAVASEPILLQDGTQKNDCELNASKRLLPQVRQVLGQEKLLMLFDSLYANGPHVRALQAQQMSYLISIKEGFVLVQVERLRNDGQLQQLSWKDKKHECTLNFANGLMLNGQNQDVLVNYLEYSQTNIKTGKQEFFGTWITDLPIDADNAREMVKVARARWKVENETFNTLKNQGYHLEHNYGHGKKYLATNFALLTMLAFLVDQIAQHLDEAFQKAWKYCKSKRSLWEKVRQVFDLLPVMSMNAIYRFIAKDIQIDFPLLE